MQEVVPKKWIGQFTSFWGDNRFNRVREHDREMFGYAVDAAVAGLVLKDKQLLRLAARYALSIGMCDHWEQSFICRFPGSSWEHRSFVPALCAEDVALTLDLAGEMFTSTGRDFLMRRLAEEALGNINFNTWKFDYIFQCNQLAWSTPGRMAAYTVLEHDWPRVKPYTELAYRDLLENLDNIILPDDGFVEGPSYFDVVVQQACASLFYYARARGLEFDSVVPDVLRQSSDFSAAIASTTPEDDVIPICDSVARMHDETLALMAALMPTSQWTTMFHKHLGRNGGLPRTVIGWQMMEKIPRQAPAAPNYVELPEMGLIASERRLGEHTVKLLVLGNRAGAGHSHEDKGSFVLEFAGETFAMAPGSCSYSNPLSQVLK